MDDDHKLHTVSSEALGEEQNGLRGPNPCWKQESFPVKRGVLTRGRMCLLLSEGYDVIDGELERERLCGVHCGRPPCVLCLAIVKRDEKELLN